MEHKSKSWHTKWSIDWPTRTFTHLSGLSIALDPEPTPLAWRFVLKSPLPAGYILNIGLLRRLTMEALRLWQAKAWNGQYLREPVLPAPSGRDRADIAYYSNLSQQELPPEKVAALLAQWEAARGLELRP